MLKSNFTGETMIFKNDKGFYATSISKTKKNPDGSTGYDNAYIKDRSRFRQEHDPNPLRPYK